MIQVISKQRGVGDTVAFLTSVTGIKYAVEKAEELGIIKDCGCPGRQEKLNEIFPYGARKDSTLLQK
jgi:hypothetical protein